MRFFLGHKLIGGFYGGISVPFHPSRIFHTGGSAPAGPVERGLGLGIELAILTGLLFALWNLTH
jgi:hypothetical protein